jgi:hypothetical protein
VAWRARFSRCQAIRHATEQTRPCCRLVSNALPHFAQLRSFGIAKGYASARTLTALRALRPRRRNASVASRASMRMESWTTAVPPHELILYTWEVPGRCSVTSSRPGARQHERPRLQARGDLVLPVRCRSGSANWRVTADEQGRIPQRARSMAGMQGGYPRPRARAACQAVEALGRRGTY